jgi:hypothetical protein
MVTHPGRHGGRFPANEHLDRLTSLQVDDDRPVVVTPRDCPVVDADDPWIRYAPIESRSAQLAQHGVGAGAQAQLGGEPSGRLATQSVTQRMQGLPMRLGSTLMPACQGADVLRKRAARTSSGRALEAPHLDPEHERLVQYRTLCQA